MDPAVHRTLVREHGWTRPEYADWIQAHDHGRAPQGYLEGGMTGGDLTIGRLIVTASRAARQAVPEAAEPLAVFCLHTGAFPVEPVPPVPQHPPDEMPEEGATTETSHDALLHARASAPAANSCAPALDDEE